jgi:hypothetical protein
MEWIYRVEWQDAGPVFGYFLSTSPGWLETMRIPLLRGRDLRESDTSPGEAVVNESFAKTYFENDDPIGKWFMKGDNRRDCRPGGRRSLSKFARA